MLRLGLFLKQTEARRAEKIFLETAPAPYLRVWMTWPPPLPEGLNPLLKRDNGELKRAWMSSIREVQNVLGQVIFKISEAKKKMRIPILGKNEALKRVIYNS